MKWIIGFFSILNNGTGPGIVVGSRVRTAIGEGVVVGWSINIKYDNHIPGQHPNHRTWSHNLSEIEFL